MKRNKLMITLVRKLSIDTSPKDSASLVYLVGNQLMGRMNVTSTIQKYVPNGSTMDPARHIQRDAKKVDHAKTTIPIYVETVSRQKLVHS